MGSGFGSLWALGQAPHASASPAGFTERGEAPHFPGSFSLWVCTPLRGSPGNWLESSQERGGLLGCWLEAQAERGGKGACQVPAPALRPSLTPLFISAPPSRVG